MIKVLEAIQYLGDEATKPKTDETLLAHHQFLPLNCRDDQIG
jgi:hypothetical protein